MKENEQEAPTLPIADEDEARRVQAEDRILEALARLLTARREPERSAVVPRGQHQQK